MSTPMTACRTAWAPTTITMGGTTSGWCLLAGLLIATAPAAASGETHGGRPGDEQLTCEQIGRELAPSAQALSGAMAPEAGRIEQHVNKRAKEGKAELVALTPLALLCAAAAAGPTGASAPCAAMQAAYDAATAARAPKQDAEDSAMVGDMNTMMTNINSNVAGMDQARIQRLMKLAEQKNCREL